MIGMEPIALRQWDEGDPPSLRASVGKRSDETYRGLAADVQRLGRLRRTPLKLRQPWWEWSRHSDLNRGPAVYEIHRWHAQAG